MLPPSPRLPPAERGVRGEEKLAEEPEEEPYERLSAELRPPPREEEEVALRYELELLAVGRAGGEKRAPPRPPPEASMLPMAEGEGRG